MKQRWKLVLLLIIMLLLAILVVQQTASLYGGMKNLHIPSSQSRQDNSITVHKWLTATEVATKYGLSEKEVYGYLQITPEPGDEKLSLRELKNKYRKTPEEMQNNLQRILNNARNTDNRHE